MTIQRRPVAAEPSPRRRVVLVEQPEETDEEVRRRGRPFVYEPTEEDRAQVTAMAAAGLSNENIAHLLGMDKDTLVEHYAYELANGNGLATGKICGRLFRIATEQVGREAVDAGKYWLANKAGWTAANRMEHTGANGEPIAVTAEVRSLTDEERAIKVAQLLNFLTAGGVGSAAAVD